MRFLASYTEAAHGRALRAALAGLDGPAAG
jgi:hypothetical protein